MEFFIEVVSYESDNKMTPYNIAVTVAPNIFRSRENSSAEIFSHAIFYEAFISMIENYEFFFTENGRLGALTHNAVGKIGNMIEEEKKDDNIFEFENQLENGKNGFRESCESRFSNVSNRSSDML